MTVSAQADVIANKTFFTSRNELHQRGREWAASAHSDKKSTKFGANLSVRGFFSRSTNDKEMGEYFGASRDATGADAGSVQVVSASPTNALYSRDISHDSEVATGSGALPAAEGKGMTGTLSFKPSQDRFGAMVGYTQSFDVFKWKALKGLSLHVDMPVMKVQNNLHAAEAGQVASTNTGVAAGSTVSAFFKGLVTKPAGQNQQAALTHGLVSFSELDSGVEVGDIRVGLSYDFVEAAHSGIQTHIDMIIPAGNKANGKHLWEPIAGNNGHIELGVGVDGYMDAWSGKNWNVRLSGGAEYTYGFVDTEERMLGVFDTKKNAVSPWGHAALAIEDGKKGTFPLANVLTRSVNVTPGSHFEMTAGATLSFKDFFFNVGYNAYFKQKEAVEMVANSWKNDHYGYADWAYDATVAADFDAADMFAQVDGNAYKKIAPLPYGGSVQEPGKTSSSNQAVEYIGTYTGTTVKHYDGDDYYDKSKIDTNKLTVGASRNYLTTATCTTPDQEIHSFLVGAGYNGSIKGFPVGLSVNGSCELAADKAKALQGWSVCGQICVGF